MSDCGYDNVELNELINDLKNVSKNEQDSSNKNIGIAFQYSSPSSALLERRSTRSSFYNSKPTDLQLRNQSYCGSFRNVRNENFMNFTQNSERPEEITDLHRELSIVKKELAMLKRTNSLSNHPVFGNSFPSNDAFINEKSKRTMVSSQSNLSPLAILCNEIPKKASSNYGSASNVSCKIPTTSKFQYQSLNRLNSTSGFSAHRENLEKMRRHTSSRQEIPLDFFDDYYEDTEDITLQPIGRGIQTLSGSVSSMSRTENIENRNSYQDFPLSKLSCTDQMRFVKKTKPIWLQLSSSRDSCKRKLINQEAGSFIIRIQSGYKFSGGLMFELILRISDKNYSQVYDDENFEYFPLKEFNETNIKGLKLIGHALEPMFYSLDNFVVEHLDTPLGLPCCLKLPSYSFYNDRRTSQGKFNKQMISRPLNIISKKISGSLTSLSSMKSQFTISPYAEPLQEKIEIELLFLGKVKVDRMYGANAVRHAVDKVLINGYQPKRCIEIKAQLNSLSGITLIDTERILFFKKLLNPNDIVCTCVDPLHRGLNSDSLRSRGIKNSKIFGIVYYKKKILIKEHQVYVFGEFSSQMPVENVLRFIQRHFVKHS